MANPDYSGSCMIAVYPPPSLAQNMAVPDGLEPDDMHVTVAYCGDAADVDPQALVDVATELARRDPIRASIAGHARFTGGETDVAVALVDSADLEDLRRDALRALDARSVVVPREHGFTAHMTLTYLDQDADLPVDRLPARPVAFGAVSAVHGDNRTDIPFGRPDPLGEAAREAYSAGWALSGGPMTERVQAGCEAAVSYAHEHATDPDVLEVALHLGSLEGTWAGIFDRREALHGQVDRDALALWRAMLGQLDRGDTLTRIRQILGLAEAVSATDKKRRREQIAAAIAALLMLMRRTDDWQKLVALVAGALSGAHLAGWDAAHTLAADLQGISAADLANTTPPGLDPDGAHATALRVLDAGLAAAAARAARRLTADDYEPDDATLDGDLQDQLDDGTDLSSAIDTALSAAYGAAMLAGFVRQNVQLLNFLTAGDTRVCPVCDEAEVNSPYTPATFPSLPIHPGCRCVPAPA